MSGLRVLAASLFLTGSTLASISSGPVISTNFPDPGILSYNGTLYAYATQLNGTNIQLARSHDGGESFNVLNRDALPDIGAWATSGATWAPAPLDLGNGNVMLYYSALSTSTGSHCVAAATATTPLGPFTPQPAPIRCNATGGGAIDPSPFRDSNGDLYVVYKVDGNNLGGGGTCGNGNEEYSTPIMLQLMECDGVTPNGAPMQLLDRIAADGPLIEAPSLVLVKGTYFLFFSRNCFNTKFYDISYATASSVHGPYTRSEQPFLKTGDFNLTAPGGAMPLPDGSLIVFHASSSLPPHLTRLMWTSRPTFSGTITTP